MDKNFTQEDLYKLSAVEIYKLILSGRLKIFPKGFWQRPEAENNAVEITKYLIEDILKWEDKDIKQNISSETFRQNRLIGMFRSVFEGSTYKTINATYPDKFKPWELNCVSQGYWTIETGIAATKWLVEEKLKWTYEDIKQKLSRNVFKQNGLDGMFLMVFNCSTYKAINYTYPGRFKPWELNCVPKKYWTIETGTESTKWLIEEKLKWTDEDIKQNLSAETFKENGLGIMLVQMFKSSPYKAINATYPSRFKPWELKSVSKGYWTIETGIEATKWLIETKLKWTDEDVKQKLSLNVFKQNGLYGMLEVIFESSPYKSISAAYPERFNK